MQWSRRDILRQAAVAAAAAALPAAARAQANQASAASATVSQWGVFELTLSGPATGNPFVEVEFSAAFTRPDGSRFTAPGFYDGAGLYRVRTMPEVQGQWSFRTASRQPELDGKEGLFQVVHPAPGVRGPVRVQDKYHFAYADGTPYRELGTTCYAWTSQPAALQQQTLATLRTAPFNKLRMCVFPKWFQYNHNEPPLYPFEGQAPNQWDYTRFNLAFFQNFERRVAQLGELGIEADIILFHPYDEGHWGFDRMGAEHDDRYLRYVLARLSAYRNVWWSLANEWDYFKTMTEADFTRFGEIIAKNDPSRHLCSIHQQKKMFDHSKPWITHVSVQNDNPDNAAGYLRQWNKPVIFDECRYEGDILEGWGDITAERLAGNFWKTLVAGAFCGHGETYLNAREELWWSKGGVLTGRCPALLAFFRKIVDAAPAAATVLPERNTWGVAGVYYLTYLWDRQHATQSYKLPEGAKFKAEIIDTLALTVTPVPGEFSGKAEIPLPIKPYLAIRMTTI
ncbi:MAG: DUF5060 domain-containing protein [Acidobacteriota bacterium]|nr:DUF5060 domain-containing protein [Acidobacteriota bacterium]